MFKKFVCIVYCLTILYSTNLLSEKSVSDDDARSSDQATILSPLEEEVLKEINTLRKNPPAYAEFLQNYKKYFDGKLIKIPGKIAIRTNEGIGAVDEAIRELKKTEPLETLEYSRGLSQASKSHVNDQGPKGTIGHDGSDGSSPSTRMNRYGRWDLLSAENISYGYAVARDVLIQLIVDDGVPSRGHRLNLLKKGIKFAGIGCGDHKRYRSMCVMNFAGTYTEKNHNSPAKEPEKNESKSMKDKVLPVKKEEW